MSLAHFAELENVSLAKLTRWNNRLRGVAPGHGNGDPVAQSIVPVRLQTGEAEARAPTLAVLSLRLRDGTRLKLRGPHPDVLCDAVFGALRRWEVSC